MWVRNGGNNQTGELLWILLDGGHLVAGEPDKNGLIGGVAVDPIFCIVSIGIALSHFAVRLSHGRYNFIAVHAKDGMPLGNGLFRCGRKRVYPMNGSTPLLSRNPETAREESSAGPE